MKNKMINMLMLLIVLMVSVSCELVEGIFKAGMGVGIFIVLVIVGIIILVVSKIGGKK